ncbi:hypothetical protein [Rufibacter immobilis]|uniref:hypothetical protein n=1 Tax=Rufibacter immobilis TaxID=1348778 RepID=UPI0011CD7030|nr:hypothetical protein [Rufibacter immobilis]
MKKNCIAIWAAAAMLTSSLAACGDSKPAETTGTTNTEDMVDGADGGLDSLDLPADTTSGTSPDSANSVTL